MAPRLMTSTLAIVGAAAFGALSTAAATDSSSILASSGRAGWIIPAVLTGAAIVWLVLALRLSSGRPVVLSLLLLGAAWLIADPASTTWRSLAPIAGGWLLAVGELAYWSLDFRVTGVDSVEVHVRRGLTVTALVVGSTSLALLPELDLSRLPVMGIELTAAGLLSAAAVIGVAAAMAWRLRPAQDVAASVPNRPGAEDRA